VARTLEILGERWTLLIVRDALLGVSRFGDFRRRLGITASVLTTRLEKLVSAGIIEQTPYHTRPTRYEYRLTHSGRELGLVILALMRWGDHHLTHEYGPPRTAHHERCGGLLEPILTCLTCGTAVAVDEAVTRLTRRPGQPGHRVAS
jgi:DNA-binding HxlR family transcriptional regulator